MGEYEIEQCVSEFLCGTSMMMEGDVEMNYVCNCKAPSAEDKKSRKMSKKRKNKDRKDRKKRDRRDRVVKKV